MLVEPGSVTVVVALPQLGHSQDPGDPGTGVAPAGHELGAGDEEHAHPPPGSDVAPAAHEGGGAGAVTVVLLYVSLPPMKEESSRLNLTDECTHVTPGGQEDGGEAGGRVGHPQPPPGKEVAPEAQTGEDGPHDVTVLVTL